jgi:hypothetical protein
LFSKDPTYLDDIGKTSFNWRWFDDASGKKVKAVSIENCDVCDLSNPAT